MGCEVRLGGLVGVRSAAGGVRSAAGWGARCAGGRLSRGRNVKGPGTRVRTGAGSDIGNDSAQWAGEPERIVQAGIPGGQGGPPDDPWHGLGQPHDLSVGEGGDGCP